MVVPAKVPVPPSRLRATWVLAPGLVALLLSDGWAGPSRFRATGIPLPGLVARLQPTWNDCPYGLVNDPFPGACPAYVDTDNDGYCDHSQPPPEQRGGAATADAAAEATSASGGESAPDASVAPRGGDVFRDAGRGADRAGRGADFSLGKAPAPRGDAAAADSMATEPEEAGRSDGAAAASEGGGVSDAAAGVETSLAAAPAVGTGPAGTPAAAAGGGEGVSAAPAASGNVDGSAPAAPRPSARPSVARRPAGTREYYFAWIALGTILVYSASRLLVARGRLRPSTHRRLWNVVVLFGFLGVGTTGLLLVLRVSYGLALPSPFEFLFWHVEAGIVFAIVGAIHFWWHWRYYWRIVRPARRRDTGADASRVGRVEER